MNAPHIISEEYFLAIEKIPNKAIRDAITKLLLLGLPPIPVVPRQLNGGYEPINGKAPSYLDSNSKPRLLKHRQLGLHDRLPTHQEIQQWFTHPDIGIGTFGLDNLYWMDFDAKHFDTNEECDRAVESWLDQNKITAAWRERTGGGGYRVLVELEIQPDFTNFALEQNGKHVGEIKGQGGFVVLAPSLHPSGNRYELISGDKPGKLYFAEFAGLYPTKANEEKPRTAKTPKPSPTGFKPEHSNKPVDPEPFEVPTEWLHWEPLKQAEYIGKHPNCQWMFDDYDYWVKWGMALYNFDWENGFIFWDELSKQSPKYNFMECCRKWGGFRKGSMGMGTLIYWGQQSGLIFPTGKGDRQAFRKSEGFKQWREYQKYTPDPDKVVNQEKLDVSEYVNKDEDQVLCVKSGLGTGKTHDSAKWRIKRDRGSREFYAINDLALNTIDRLQETTGENHYHLRFDDDGRQLLADPNSHIHNCIDSLRKYLPGHFEGTDKYCDEAVAVLGHTANGETLGSAQASIIRKLNGAFESDGSNFLMDGGLRDLECDLVAKKSGKKVVKILNERPSPRRKATFITGVKINEDGNEQKDGDDITAICSLMISRLKSGHKLWVGTDSKNLSKRLADLLTEDKNLKDYGFRVQVWNSENSKEPEAKEFKKNPQKWLEENHCDVVIISPSCAYGIDVQNPIINSKPWFTEQHYAYRGVIGTLPQIQQMRRLRDDNVPTFVFCPERSTIPRDGVLGSCYVVQEYQRRINKLLAEAAQSGSSPIANLDYFHHKLGESLNEVDKDWLEYSIKLQVIDNFEKENLKECLIYALEQANYEIEEVNLKTCSETKAMLDDAKERINVIDSSKVFHAPEIDEQAYEALMQQAEKSDEERAIIEKHKLLKRLPGIKDSGIWSVEFIKRQVVEENNKLIEGLELCAALDNTEKAKKALGISWMSVFSDNDGEHSYKSSLSPIRQIRKTKFHQRAIALTELGIPVLIDELLEGREITKNDEDVRKIVQKWRESYVYKLGLYPEKPQKKKGKVIEGSETIPSIKKLLELVAFPLTKGKKKKVDGKVLTPYLADTEALGEHERCVIEECIARREEEKVAEINAKFEEKAQKLLAEGELITAVKSFEGIELYEKLKELEQTKESLNSEIAKLSSDLQTKINKAKALGALTNQGVNVEPSPTSEGVPSVREARQWAYDQGLSSREIKILSSKLSPRASVPQKIFEFVELTKVHIALTQTERAMLVLETVRDEYELMEVMQEFPREKVEDAIDVLDTLEQRQKLRSMLVKAEKLVAC